METSEKSKPSNFVENNGGNGHFEKIVYSFFLNLSENIMRMSVFISGKPIKALSLFDDLVDKMNETSEKLLKFDKNKVLIKSFFVLNPRKVFSLPKAFC